MVQNLVLWKVQACFGGQPLNFGIITDRDSKRNAILSVLRVIQELMLCLTTKPNPITQQMRLCCYS